MIAINCLVPTEEIRNLVAEIKASYPDKYASILDSASEAKVDEVIMAEIATKAKDLGGRTPTISEMKDYYQGKQSASEIAATLSQEISPTNVDTLQKKAAMSFTSTQQREDRVTLISRLFSAVAEDMFQEAKTVNPSLKNKQAFIVNNLTNILSEVQDNLTPTEDDDEYTRFGLQQIQDNWQMLLEEASHLLFTTEGVALSFVTATINESDESADKEEEMKDSEDSEYVAKDGLQMKAREVDLRDTLSEQVRKLLNTIPRLGKDGQVDTDDLGYPRYINADFAHIKLMDALSSIYSCTEMDKALSSLQGKYPWVKSVVDRINEDNKLKALFYNDLRKEFIPYWIEVGNQTKQVNKTPGIYYLFNEWRANYEAGITLDEDSIYNSRNQISNDNGTKGLAICTELNNGIVETDNVEDYIINSIPKLRKILNMIGIDFSDEEISNTILLNPRTNFGTIVNQCAIVFSDAANGRIDNSTDFINSYDSVYTIIANLFNTVPEGSTLATFREAGKTYQSYSAPSYLGRLFNGIKGSFWKEVMEEQYEKYPQFFNSKTGYKSEWLQLLNNSKRYRDLLDRKVVLHRDKKTFNNWTYEDHLKAQVTEFFSIPDNESAIPAAWYALPLLADAESAEFIRFRKYITDEQGTVESKIIPLLAKEVLNEYERITVVLKRKELRDSGIAIQPIANFDIVGSKPNGSEFKFFPLLNTTIISDEIADKYGLTRGSSFAKGLYYLDNNHKPLMLQYISEVLAPIEEQAYQNFLDTAKAYYIAGDNTIAAPIREGSSFEEDIKEYFYNNALAYTQMVRLTTTDLAYYKDLNDFQKRFKEVYGMTLRLYTQSQYGKPFMKTVILKDIVKKSNSYEDIKSIFENKFGTNNPEVKKILKAYEEVNIADAQAFRTLDSYRAVMDMAGRWTPEMEEAFNRLSTKDWNLDDFNVIWQTLKPFMFTQNSVTSGYEYGDLKVPMQLKNSEAILMALYNKIAENVAQSDVLRGLNKFMLNRGIDSVNFESAIKAGNQGAVDLSEEAIKAKIAASKDKVLSVEDAVINILNDTCYPNNVENSQIVHTLDYEDYGLQVASTEHLLDHEDVLGAQFKKLIEADLPDDIKLTLPGVKYTEQHPYTTKQELHDLYQSLLTENILDGFKEISKKFIKRDGTPNYEEVEKLIQKEMAGNSRYTDEERKACTLVERDGKKVFNIPLFDPIQSNRIQQLLFSIIRKNVARQTTRRATCVQATSWGLTDELNIRFKDSNGNFIFNESEWEDISLVQKSQKKLWNSLHKTYTSYQDYAASTKASAVACWEAYLPAYSKQFFAPLMEKDGNLNINKLPEDLRRCIGLRVPTESKYSMQPIYIKGFLPSAMGSVVMLPADVTTVVGSDFDFDKVLITLPEFKVYDYDVRQARYYYEKEVASDWKLMEALVGQPIDTLADAEDFDDDLIEEGKTPFKTWIEQNKYRFPVESPIIKRINYNYNKSASTQSNNQDTARKARNNAIIDCAWGVLTNESVADSALRPGGFEEASRVAAICNVIHNLTQEEIKELSSDGTFTSAIDNLLKLDKKQAKTLASKLIQRLDPLSPLTQLFFHQQNANGGKMIGVYAIANASHAEGQWCNLELKEPVNLFGKSLSKIDNIENEDGQIISDVLSNFLAASVDNVKDPVLKALNQNGTTGDVTTLMGRLGFSLLEIGLFLNAPMPKANLESYGTTELTLENIAWATYISDHQDIFNKLNEAQKNNYYKILNTVKTIYDTLSNDAKAFKLIVDTSRGDNPQASGGPTIGDTIIRYLNLERVRDLSKLDAFPINSDILDLDFILDNNYGNLNKSYDSALPFLQAATKCGVVGPMYLMEQFFPQLQPKILNLLLDKNVGLAKYVDLVGGSLSKDKAIKLINAFFNEFYLYSLSGTKFFGTNGVSDSARENYYQYATQFPEYFDEIRKKFSDELRDNQFISQIKVSRKNEYNPIPQLKFTNTGNLSKRQKNRITKDWEALLFSSNPEIQKLGYQLFKYAQFYGLTYQGPQSFIQLAPDVLRSSLPDYNDTLNSLLNSSSGNFVPYVAQFVRNHFVDGFVKNISDNEISGTEDGLIALPKNYSDSTFLSHYNTNTQSVDYYQLYSIDEGKNIAYYTRVTALGNSRGLKEYYYGKDWADTALPKEAITRESQIYNEVVDGAEDFIESDYMIKDENEGIDVTFDGGIVTDASGEIICI